MKSIRCGRGLGDSIYLQSIARHLAERGEQLVALTDYPDLFRPLEGRVGVAPFTRLNVDIVAHYVTRKGFPGSDQFEDACRAAGIRGPVELTLGWQPRNHELIRRVRASGRPVVCVQLPRAPMGRTDGFGKELLPNCSVLQHLITQLRTEAFIVQVGSGEPLHRFEGIDLDLAGQTSVADLLDVVSASDGCLGYVSFIVPLAEALQKPALLVWSHKGLRAPQRFIRQITPQKVLHRKSSLHVVDSWDEPRILEVLYAFRAAIGCRSVLQGQERGDRGERAGLAA